MPPFSRILRSCVVAAVLTPAVVVAARAANPAPATKPADQADAPAQFIYKLSPSDRVRIVVFGEPDLSTIARIGANGNVNLYLIGDVHIGGATVNEAQKTIETAYHDGRYLRNPQVTVTVEEYAPRTVTVDGQVKNPGPVTLPAESSLTVYQAIIRAGGFTDVAKGSAVTVTRILPDGTKKVFVIDVERLIRGKDRNKSDDDTLPLEPGDIIYVPEKLI